MASGGLSYPGLSGNPCPPPDMSKPNWIYVTASGREYSARDARGAAEPILLPKNLSCMWKSFDGRFEAHGTVIHGALNQNVMRIIGPLSHSPHDGKPPMVYPLGGFCDTVIITGRDQISLTNRQFNALIWLLAETEENQERDECAYANGETGSGEFWAALWG